MTCHQWVVAVNYVNHSGWPNRDWAAIVRFVARLLSLFYNSLFHSRTILCSGGPETPIVSQNNKNWNPRPAVSHFSSAVTVLYLLPFVCPGLCHCCPLNHTRLCDVPSNEWGVSLVMFATVRRSIQLRKQLSCSMNRYDWPSRPWRMSMWVLKTSPLSKEMTTKSRVATRMEPRHPHLENNIQVGGFGTMTVLNTYSHLTLPSSCLIRFKLV